MNPDRSLKFRATASVSLLFASETFHRVSLALPISAGRISASENADDDDVGAN